MDRKEALALNKQLRSALQHNLERATALTAKCRETLGEFVKLSTQPVPASASVPETKNKHQPHLRLVISRDDRFAVPRRYDQSTSGRTDSTGTAPPLSRSNAIAVDSAILSLVESALRRYPSVVPQRSAYRTWSSTSNVLRYARRGSDMQDKLPHSNSRAIPFVALPPFPDQKNEGMADKEALRLTRQRRLRELLNEMGQGGRIKLADAIGVEPNYISQLTSPRMKKPFGEDTARNIERAANKPQYWLDSEDESIWRAHKADEWPFSFDRALWDNLPANRRMDLEANLHATLLGLTAIEAATQQQKKRRQS